MDVYKYIASAYFSPVYLMVNVTNGKFSSSAFELYSDGHAYMCLQKPNLDMNVTADIILG